ncbi:MAG: AAA family ATPase [Elusimicrobia bacterium]|nr:AAA family ATPase [Elusimicrobiota bacterium]
MFNRRLDLYLAKWMHRGSRKPLVLRGARQVGKTSTALTFAEKHFKNVVHVNLEKAEHRALFREPVSLEDFERIVRIKFQRKIVPGETLIFLDEIQNSAALISLLRFLYEERPAVHVIAAGSLLEAKIEKEGLALPVGRVEHAYLYPMDFFEYLDAKGESGLLDFLRSVSPEDKTPEAVHGLAMKAFHEYAMLGGMPEIVKMYLENGSLEDLKAVYSSLFTGYSEDVHKYSSQANAKYLAYVIEKSPLFAGTNIAYEKFGGSSFRSREMGMAFELLEKAMLLHQLQATSSTNLPLVPQRKRPKKLLFLDVGLVNHQMGIQQDFLNPVDLNDFYRGRIAEQVIGQNILAQFEDFVPRAFYWAREKPMGNAEVDFCLDRDGAIVGVEVKSGKSNRLRSLFSFGKLIKRSRLVRVYGGTLRREKIEIDGFSLDLMSLPFYLAPRIMTLGTSTLR